MFDQLDPGKSDFDETAIDVDHRSGSVFRPST
jgi:hypothetical protein